MEKEFRLGGDTICNDPAVCWAITISFCSGTACWPAKRPCGPTWGGKWPWWPAILQKVVPGTLFLCKGAAFKGRYLSDALQKGAFAYVSERPYPEGGAAPCIQVTDIRTAMGPHGRPRLRSARLSSPLPALRGPRARPPRPIISNPFWTPGGRRGRGPAPFCPPSSPTTAWSAAPPSSPPRSRWILQRHLFHAWSAGAEYVTMEVSSQALKYGRVIGVDSELRGLSQHRGGPHLPGGAPGLGRTTSPPSS